MKTNLPRNVIFGFLSWLLPLGLTFIATPLVVHHLGVEEFGLYALVLGFIGYSFTFSVGRAVTKYVSEYRAMEQTERINEVLAATLWLNVLVGIIGALILAAISRPLVSQVFEIKPEMQEKAVVAFYLSAITVFFVMLAQVFNAVVQAIQRFDVYSSIMTLTAALGITGNIALVLLGRGLLDLLIWNLVNTVFSCLLFYFAGRKLLPEARWSGGFKRQSLLMIAKFAGGITVSQFLFNFLLLFERGLITRTLGTDDLTYYVVPMNLTGQIHGFAASLLLIIFPLTSELSARMETERLRSIYERVSKYICALVVFIVASFSVCGHEFFRLWLNAEFADKITYIVVMQAVTFGTIAIGIVTWQMMEGFGNTNRNAIVAAIWVTLSIGLMSALGPVFRLEGIGLGRMLGCVTMLVYIFVVERWIFGKALWAFWFQVLFSLGAAVLLASTIEFISLKYIAGNWLGLFVAVMLGGITFIAILTATRYLTIDERRSLQGLFLKAFPKLSESR